MSRQLRSYERAVAEEMKEAPNRDKVWGHLMKAHELGDARATYAIGTWHLHGHHVPRDDRRGVRYIREAAETGVPDAQYDLAVCYEIGIGIGKNPTKAAPLYLRAALSGDSQAVFEIGRCFYYGIGVARSRAVASVWLDRAAQLGTYEGTGRAPRKATKSKILKR